MRNMFRRVIGDGGDELPFCIASAPRSIPGTIVHPCEEYSVVDGSTYTGQYESMSGDKANKLRDFVSFDRA
ncbi:hypothetical protein BDQ94DRAFT_139820 [Aspergillus welwitschiae]|uniref:Uncharacterized protein n=1 Tax=Aspergillus welwitschiae TaxID=1341132 RepID=A0A3F3Q8X6_9EURO|nr:hypothetical protein BDQ94DRAFT_139820 [Aspergillus welwitschiae]RDH35585.1 hypothetical protein BDQ94DRAFT_139820 [Aspergillus welwitschiae]